MLRPSHRRQLFVRGSSSKSSFWSRLRLERLEDRSLLATISGELFSDLNENAVRDVGEPALALAGVAMFLDANANALRDAGEVFTATDGSGHYQFSGLPAGSYRVMQEVPGGYMQTSPAGMATNHQLGDLLHAYSFPSSILTPWAVMMANGSLYVSDFYTDEAVSDVINQIDPLTGQVLSSVALADPADVITDLDFDGTHFWAVDQRNDQVLRIDPAAGAVVSSFASPGARPIGIAWDGSSLWIFDGEAGRIDHVDVNGNPIPSLPGGASSFSASNASYGLTFDGQHLWAMQFSEVVEYDPSTGQELQRFSIPQPLDASTSAGVGLAFDGQHFWVNGPDQVSWENPRLLYELEAAPFGNRGAAIVTVADADEAGGIDFGNAAVNTIDGHAFYDRDNSGTVDADDGGLANWRVYLDADNDGAYDAGEQFVRTNAAGDYRMIVRDSGTFTVRIELDDQVYGLTNWSVSAPVADSYSVTFAASSGGAEAAKDFGAYLDRSVVPSPTDWAKLGDGGGTHLYTGMTWVDETVASGSFFSWGFSVDWAANSTRNGFDDWRMPTLSEAQTAATQYLIGNAPGLLDGGERFSDDRHYWTSTAKGNSAYLVRLNDPAGDTVTLLKGSFMSLAMLRDAATTIDDGAAGYSDTGWNNASGGYQGDNHQRAAGNGSQTATWTFSGLEVGATYKIDATWKASNKLATDAPYTVIDGSVTEGTVRLSQKQTPNDYQANGVSWEGLGIYTSESGTLQVRLSNDANGTVSADAIRVFRVYPAVFPAGSSATLFSSDTTDVALAISQPTGGSGQESTTRTAEGKEELLAADAPLHTLPEPLAAGAAPTAADIDAALAELEDQDLVWDGTILDDEVQL